MYQFGPFVDRVKQDNYMLHIVVFVFSVIILIAIFVFGTVYPQSNSSSTVIFYLFAAANAILCIHPFTFFLYSR